MLVSNNSRFKQRDDYGNWETNVKFVQSTGLVRKGTKILEIGSGTGRLLNGLLSQGFDTVGVEKSEKMIKRSGELHGRLPLVRGDGNSLPFLDESFDIVMSFDVFEHIRDTDHHINEVRRVLKKEGYYVLQTPNKWTNSIFETVRWKSLTRWREDHCSLHNYWQLKHRFLRNGFEIAFSEMPVVSVFFRRKVEAYLGQFGLALLTILNPDKFPCFLRTNFYLRAKKRA
jgi:ubiquinone/menaquinone biosynthesis C-methylase UbiE